MLGVDQWVSGGVAASALPVWVAGALAALLVVAGVLAFPRAGQPGWLGSAARVALLTVGAGVMWLVVEANSTRDASSSSRRILEARNAELTVQAIAPGSALACLEALSNETVEAACEKIVFASPQTVAAAVAYVDARLTLLADGAELAARDRSYAASMERLRRGIEADRYGIVAHVLTTRGCTAADCATLKLLRDPRQVSANLRERSFDANVILHAANWGAAPAQSAMPPVAAMPSTPSLAAVPPPAMSTTGTSAPTGKFDFPSSASIPAISIMNAEPPGPPIEALAPQQGGPPGAAPARTPAPRRQTARETTSQQPPQAAPAQPVPLPPPGTIANPR